MQFRESEKQNDVHPIASFWQPRMDLVVLSPLQSKAPGNGYRATDENEKMRVISYEATSNTKSLT